MSDFEHVTFIRSMRGAPAAILLALLFTGRSITNKELQLITGYTDKPVASALGVLQVLGFAQNNGRYSGWSFPLSAQLPLFHYSTAVSNSGLLPLPADPDTDALSKRSHIATAEAWLLRAGISPNSKKMTELLSADLHSDYIRSWVLEYEWWQREKKSSSRSVVSGRRKFSVGTLIKILQDGDNAPAMRCEDCLVVLPCYCDLVHR